MLFWWNVVPLVVWAQDTQRLQAEPLVTLVREEVREIPDEGIVVLAVGPLVSESLAASIAASAA